MTAVVILLFGISGLLGIAALTYALRHRSIPLRAAPGMFLAPAALYAAAYLVAIATSTPQTYAVAPGTAWAELLGRLGFWLGLAGGVAVMISAIAHRYRQNRS